MSHSSFHSCIIMSLFTQQIFLYLMDIFWVLGTIMDAVYSRMKKAGMISVIMDAETKISSPPSTAPPLPVPQTSCILSGDSRGEQFYFLVLFNFWRLSTFLGSWPLSPSSNQQCWHFRISLTSSSITISPSLTLTLLPPSHKNPCTYIGPPSPQ